MGSRGLTGGLEAAGLRVAVIAARYNQEICDQLLEGALSSLRSHGATEEAILVVRVPGAVELPLAALHAARSGRFDAVICLGCVIKGETAHFEYVAGEASAGVMRVALDTGVPCAFGVLTTYDHEQAVARSGPVDNKGAEAAETAIEMANLIKRLA